MGILIPLIVILLAAALVLREDTVLRVLYLVVGIYILGLLWSKNAPRHVHVKRDFTGRAFFNQGIPVRLHIHNKGWLPVVWLKVQESLPLELAVQPSVQEVVTLGPRGKATVEYEVQARKRGYYHLGPLMLESGDLLGLSSQTIHQLIEDDLIVYPRIYPLAQIGLPSRSPFGSIREHHPIFEDPSRVRGKRDYVHGDSQRRIDWKSTAAVGRLQVKQYEPAIALDVCVVLNLDPADYDPKHYEVSAETAIVAAASIAGWVNRQQQAIGLSTNGSDPFADAGAPAIAGLPPRRGSAALMPVLDLLARVRAEAKINCSELLRQASANLGWGTTLVLVTSHFDMNILENLLAAQRRGLNMMIVAVAASAGQREIHSQAGHFNIPVHRIDNESDLEIWTQTA